MEVAGIILHNILKNPEKYQDLFPKLKKQYFHTSFAELYSSMHKYYNTYNTIPNFLELEIINSRNGSLVLKIEALKLLDVDEDIDIDVAYDALVDEFTQDSILDELEPYIEKLVHYDSRELVDRLSNIVMKVEELVDSSEEIVLMNDLFLLDEEELKRRVPLGLNNDFDARTGGMSIGDLVMIGGHRGSGKSLVGCNIVTNQHKNNNVSLFFTIEMRATEINQRLTSILSGVSNTAIKNQSCNNEELVDIAQVRKNFFLDSDEVYEDYLKHKNYRKFELDLSKSKKLRDDNQIIMIDDHAMTLSMIDANIQKFKNIYGEKLRTVVVDHVNEISIDDKYDWKSQIALSKKLKDFAAKYDVLLLTPYQTDKTGEARFAKGLLDSADIAMNLTNHGEYIEFDSQKTRGMPSFTFNAPFSTTSLALSPDNAIVEEAADEEKESARDM